VALLDVADRGLGGFSKGMRQRVKMALRHEEPDRVPTDFLATPEVWSKLIAHEQPDASGIDGTYIEPAREALLRRTAVLSVRPPLIPNRFRFWSPVLFLVSTNASEIPALAHTIANGVRVLIGKFASVFVSIVSD